MNKFAKSFHRSQKGFTLIELLIVIVILGVLAAAIIPNLSKFVGSGQVGAANAELASVKTAISAYQADTSGLFPCASQPAGGVGEAVVEASILSYISGADVVGTYKVDNLGIVTGQTYTGLTWDAVGLKWKK